MALRFKVNNQGAGLISTNNTLLDWRSQVVGYFHWCCSNGCRALGSNNNKNDLVAIGDSALYNNSTGSSIGTTSIDNSALGAKAFSITHWDVTTLQQVSRQCIRAKIGAKNTANGDQALYSDVNGNFNTAVGYQSLYSKPGKYNSGRS